MNIPITIAGNLAGTNDKRRSVNTYVYHQESNCKPLALADKHCQLKSRTAIAVSERYPCIHLIEA